MRVLEIGRFISDLNEDNVSDEDVQKLDYPDHQDRKIRQGGNENTGILGRIGRKIYIGEDVYYYHIYQIYCM